MAVVLATMIWLLPPRAIERRLQLKTEQPTPTLFRDRVPEPKPGLGLVICPTWGPCWRMAADRGVTLEYMTTPKSTQEGTASGRKFEGHLPTP